VVRKIVLDGQNYVNKQVRVYQCRKRTCSGLLCVRRDNW
jgi:hypothetical protein